MNEGSDVFAQFGLDSKLLKGLAALGLEKPTPVQDAMIPAILAGHDVQASAKTGSGKSAAFLLPLLQRMLAKPMPLTAARCLVLAPTRELALQLERHCRDLARFTPINALAVVGGEALKPQQAKLRKNPEIIIGTPGRILEHLQKKSLETADLEFLVLDEADRMLDMGFRDDVLAIAARCSPLRQTILLSATLDHRDLAGVSKQVQNKPEVIAIGTHRAPHESIRHEIILADDLAHKRQLCNWLLANDDYKKALVFTNTRDHADALAAFLVGQGRRTACLHGEMAADERKRVMQLFRDGKVNILVATDLAARGLDVAAIDLVINFAMARSGDEYVHRSGRTGRAGAQGRTVSLIGPQEWNRMESAGRYLNVDFERREIEGLVARFKGPAVKKKGAGAKPKAAPKVRDPKEKAKQRHRNRKNVGKRRETAKPEKNGKGKTATDKEGLAPLSRK